MRDTDVEWDDNKNETNKREHEGLGFELAQLVFADSNRLERIDRSESNMSGEEWIISARLANKAERRNYHGNYQIDGEGWSKAD
jgi:uncharacterized DUF497 family protein